MVLLYQTILNRHLIKYNSELIKNLIVIPITAQILHFYLDSKLWKFSESHNRSAVLHYLKK